MIDIRIERVANGFIISDAADQKVVIEEDDKKEKDCQAIRTMLYEVLDGLGEYGSKHDAERIRISIINQDDEEVKD